MAMRYGRGALSGAAVLMYTWQFFRARDARFDSLSDSLPFPCRSEAAAAAHRLSPALGSDSPAVLFLEHTSSQPSTLCPSAWCMYWPQHARRKQVPRLSMTAGGAAPGQHCPATTNIDPPSQRQEALTPAPRLHIVWLPTYRPAAPPWPPPASFAGVLNQSSGDRGRGYESRGTSCLPSGPRWLLVAS